MQLALIQTDYNSHTVRLAIKCIPLQNVFTSCLSLFPLIGQSFDLIGQIGIPPYSDARKGGWFMRLLCCTWLYKSTLFGAFFTLRDFKTSLITKDKKSQQNKMKLLLLVVCCMISTSLAGLIDKEAKLETVLKWVIYIYIYIPWDYTHSYVSYHYQQSH